jgi:hypothetical protein
VIDKIATTLSGSHLDFFTEPHARVPGVSFPAMLAETRHAQQQQKSHVQTFKTHLQDDVNEHHRRRVNFDTSCLLE